MGRKAYYEVDMADLHLAVKGIYFNQVLSGVKTREFRLYNEYWKKRLLNRAEPYENIIYTLGYPSREDQSRRLIFPYKGFEVTEISHSLFGDAPVKVFAIYLEGDGNIK